MATSSRASYIGGPMRDIPGFERLYAVTAEGEVWAYPREWVNGKGAPQSHDGLWLGKVLDATGYFRVRLSRGAERRFPPVHRLVALAWIPNPKDLPQVNHIDGVKTNNRVENLEWCTPGDNVRHAHAIGLHRPHPSRKLSSDGARNLRARHAGGDSVTELARDFMIHRKTVYGVLKGRTYRG